MTSPRDRAGSPWSSGLLQLYPVLERIPQPLSTSVRGRARSVAAPVGTVAFQEESPCEGLTLVTSGSIRVVRAGHNGREILLYRVHPGESCILSVSCLLGRTAYGARGIVDEDLTGVQLPADVFERLVAEAPAFRGFIFELFGARIAALMQLVEEVAFHRLDQRLAALLLRRIRDVGGAAIADTHQGLADQVGSVREIVSRVLESFESQGAISLGRGRVTVLQPAILEEAAGILGEDALPGNDDPA